MKDILHLAYLRTMQDYTAKSWIYELGRIFLQQLGHSGVVLHRAHLHSLGLDAPVSGETVTAQIPRRISGEAKYFWGWFDGTTRWF